MSDAPLVFTGDGKEIAAELKHLGGSIPKVSTLPVLSCIALEVIRGKLTARATDLDVAHRVTLPVTIESGEDGSGCCAAADLFSSLAARANGEGVRVSIHGDELSVVAGGRRATMRTLPLAEFPAVDKVADEWTTLDGAILADAMRGLVFCASADETRAILNGLYFSADGKVVACDGKRLAVLPYSVDPPACLQARVVPTKAVGPIADLLSRHKDVEVAGDESGLAFRAPGELFFTRLIEGNFPNYVAVIPNYPSAIRVAVDRAALRKALAWAKIFVDDKDTPVKIQVGDGAVTLSVASRDRGQAEETLPILSGDGAKMRAAINLRWLEGFAARDGGEHFLFEDPGAANLNNHELVGPLVIREEDPGFLGIVMPMRINP